MTKVPAIVEQSRSRVPRTAAHMIEGGSRPHLRLLKNHTAALAPCKFAEIINNLSARPFSAYLATKQVLKNRPSINNSSKNHRTKKTI